MKEFSQESFSCEDESDLLTRQWVYKDQIFNEQKTKTRKKQKMEKKRKENAFALCSRFLNWNNFDQFKGNI